MRRVALGDPEAFAALYEQSAPGTFAVLLRMLRLRVDAEDALQETFRQVWERAADFRWRRGSAQSWITAVARSRALDHLRRRAADPRGKNESDDSQGGLPAADELVQLEVRSARVAMALEKLPHAQRTAIEMSFYRGLTASEIAAEVGVPIGTVKTRLRLALHKLSCACNATLEDRVEESR